MKGQWKILFVLIGALGLVVLSGARPQNQTAPKSYENLIYSVKGPDLFRAHCAACHGLDAKGDGPVAATLKAKPSDLTLLAKGNGGKFPSVRIEKFISGDEHALQMRGSREMPVWGPIFHQIEEDQDFGNVRLHNLIEYLKTIQRN